MTPLMKKAGKGNRDALTAIYQSNKQNVFHVCNLLLCDTKAADQACVHIFKKGFEYVLSGTLESEEEFADYILKKTVNHCKNKTLKKNNKAFRIPANKNFALTQYSPDAVVTEGNIYKQVLASLPSLHRFIYVLHYYTKWSDEEIAELIHINAASVQSALLAEQTNLMKITDSISKKTNREVSVKPNEFHSFIQIEITTDAVSRAVDSIVLLAIDSISDPIEQKARKKARTVILSSVVSLCLIIGLIFGIALLVNNNDDLSDDETGGDQIDSGNDYEAEEITWLTEVEDPTHYAIIEIADYGTITVALDGNTAPETVENFVSLAEEGFYDGLTFHRIYEGFVIQGGDPNADGTGGNTDEDGNEINITGEFYYNGYDNYLSHVRGAISMARGNGYDSASSQFFIVHEDSTYSLDMFYAAFGYVIDGMDVVDVICEAAEPIDDNGTIEYENQPVIAKITAYTAEEYETMINKSSDITDENETVTE